MTAIAVQSERSSIQETVYNGQKKPISWAEFQKKYLHRDDKFKYEWVNGFVEKTPRTINQLQQIIFDNLVDFFDRLRSEGKVNGRLSAEVDTFFLDKVHRRPNGAYFSAAQRVLMAKSINQIPQFVIEIISTTDEINRVYAKMKNYRAAKVPVVWHIFPELQEVHIYHDLKMQICVVDMICSAAPVLPDFNIPLFDIFKDPID